MVNLLKRQSLRGQDPRVKEISCLKFKQFSLVLALGFTIANYSQASEDQVSSPPPMPESWVSKLFIEDEKGVMASMKEQMAYWREQDEYAQKWNLESTGQYRGASVDEKSQYLRRNILRYVDKRLSGEIKKSPKNSTLHKIGKMQKTLKPSTSVNFSKSVKMRFKAKVIQGRASMYIENPLADYTATVKVNGRMQMNLKRDLKPLGVQANVDYDVREGRWIASFDKQLNEQFKTRVSSQQQDENMAFTSGTDRRVELIFGQSF